MKTNKKFLSDPVEMFPDEELMAPDKAVVDGDDDSDRPPWAGGNKELNPHRPDNDGKPDHAGSKKGELFGDQIVLLREGDGEPVLDEADQYIAVGYDPDGLIRPNDADHLFPIYFEKVGEDDYEIPAKYLPYVQEVELERANVARAPDRVIDKALNAALEKIDEAVDINTDPAGRLKYKLEGDESYTTIDAPLENLALYQYLMTPQGVEARAWPDVTGHWSEKLYSLLGSELTDPDWDPSALLGAAWSKTGEITLDAMIYENTTLGINEVDSNGGTLEIDYFDFSTEAGELYNYDREAQYGDQFLRWIEVEDEAPVFKYGSVYNAVFDATPWAQEQDKYLTVDEADMDDFDLVDATMMGVNDFAQAADDSRAVIDFMHTYTAVEIDESEVPDAFMTDALLS